MREIKFRAWHTLRQEMFPVWGLDFDHFDKSDMNVRNIISDPGKAMEVERIFDEGGKGRLIILMQYTGLKDKNGVEIYENDIVRRPAQWFDDVDLGDVVVGFIAWSENSGWFPFCATDSTIEGADCEVIGNLHETPELLK